MILRESEQAIEESLLAWKNDAVRIAKFVTTRFLNRRDKIVVWLNGAWIAINCDTIQRVAVSCRELTQIVPYAHSMNETCLWVCLDNDNHDSREDIAQRNFDTMTGILNTLLQLGVVALLEDSDGQGGFHLWIFFSSPIPIELAYRFARWICSDYPNDKSAGFEIEKNPKQRVAAGDGNGVRVPGRHHKRNYVSRFLGDGEWLAGQEAIDLMLNTPLNDPSVLELMGDYDPDARPTTQATALPKRTFNGRADGSRTLPEQAEEYLNSHFDWPTLLRHYGWHGGPDHWTRPGKDHGTSATLNFNGNGLLWVFSQAAAVPVDGNAVKAGSGFGKFRFWLHHNGFTDAQQTEAARRLLLEVSR